MNLNEIAGGGLQELFSHEMDKVLKNIKDPNTDPKAARKINIQLTIKADEQRMVGNVDIKVSHTSAPIRGLATNILMEKDGNSVTVEEISERLPGQVEIANIINIEGVR